MIFDQAHVFFLRKYYAMWVLQDKLFRLQQNIHGGAHKCPPQVGKYLIKHTHTKKAKTKLDWFNFLSTLRCKILKQMPSTFT